MKLRPFTSHKMNLRFREQSEWFTDSLNEQVIEQTTAQAASQIFDLKTSRRCSELNSHLRRQIDEQFILVDLKE